MYKYSLRFATLMAVVLASTLSLTSCSDNDDDSDQPDTPPTTIDTPHPTKLMAGDHELISTSYDSNGRMTRLTIYDYYNGQQRTVRDVQASYSPFKLVFKEDYSTMTISDASFNNRGFIAKAKVTDNYEGEIESYWMTMNYDSDDHLTSFTADGERLNITWSNGNLVDYAGEVQYTYSSEKNTAKNICYQAYMMVMAEFWLTGLFGEIPANFPSKAISDDSDFNTTYSYTLNTDGTIKTETATQDGDAMTLTYIYGSRSLDNTFSRSFGEVKSFNTNKRILNPLRRLHK